MSKKTKISAEHFVGWLRTAIYLNPKLSLKEITGMLEHVKLPKGKKQKASGQGSKGPVWLDDKHTTQADMDQHERAVRAYAGMERK